MPRLRWLFAILIVLSTSVVHADAQLEEAKRVAKAANIHYQLGRFQEASDAYTHSYELAPTPGLLFNLGQCQMALKNWSRAIFFFEGYLRDKPDAPNAALVRDLEAEAHKEIAAQEAKTAAEEAAKLEAMRPIAPPPKVEPPPPPRDPRRLPAIALGAASIALLGAAMYLGIQSDAARDDAHLSAGETKSSFKSDRTTFAIAAGATGGVALGAAVASGVLGYFAWRPHKVLVAPTTKGAAISGSF